MRISLCNEVVGEFDFARAMRACAQKFGYDGIEIAPFTLSDDPPRLTAAERKDIRKIAADHGLAITACIISCARRPGFRSPAPTTRRERAPSK